MGATPRSEAQVYIENPKVQPIVELVTRQVWGRGRGEKTPVELRYGGEALKALEPS